MAARLAVLSPLLLHAVWPPAMAVWFALMARHLAAAAQARLTGWRCQGCHCKHCKVITCDRHSFSSQLLLLLLWSGECGVGAAE